MAAWLTYLRERFPLPAYLLLVTGLLLSGAWLKTAVLDVTAAASAFVGLLLFFALLRLMDELKDLGKDRVAHPERPLPRGLLGREAVARAIGVGAASMLALSLVTAVVVDAAAGACYLAVTAYLWLMYREFYVGQWLERRPIAYALSHQLVLVPLCYFTVFLFQVVEVDDRASISYVALVLGAFFAYEVCRKLDPQAHPVLRTYLAVYGRGGTLLLTLAALGVSAMGAIGLQLYPALLPVHALVLLSLALAWVRPGRFRAAEAAAALSLALHIWAVPIRKGACSLDLGALCNALT